MPKRNLVAGGRGLFPGTQRQPAELKKIQPGFCPKKFRVEAFPTIIVLRAAEGQKKLKKSAGL